VTNPTSRNRCRGTCLSARPLRPFFWKGETPLQSEREYTLEPEKLLCFRYFGEICGKLEFCKDIEIQRATTLGTPHKSEQSEKNE